MSVSLVNAANRSTSTETSIDFTMHRLATEYNDPSAQYLVGRNYLKGKSVEKNIKEAIKWFEMAAKQNHIRAQFQLGSIYLYGKGIKENLNLAFYYLSKAAERNHLESQYELANYYLKGTANKRQYQKAGEWYKRAARRGHVRSQFELGKLLFEGKGLKQNTDEAIAYLNEAAESGLLEATSYINNIDFSTVPKTHVAQETDATELKIDNTDLPVPDIPKENNRKKSIDNYKLGIAYLTGDGKEKNIYEAAAQFKIASNSGHGKAQYQLAKLYKQGIGVKQDEKLHLHWLEKAAQAGVNSAARDLASIRGNNKNTNLKESLRDNPEDNYKRAMSVLSRSSNNKETKTAIALLLEAANKNHGLAQYQLGRMNEKGIDVPRNIEKARSWFKKSASNNVSKAQAALVKLGKSDESLTTIVVKDDKTFDDPLKSQLIEKNSSTINSFLTNAKNGDQDAQYQVAINYLEGKQGFDQDVKKAIDWLQTAANNNYSKASTTLGLLYYEGKKVDRDYRSAATWLEKSANNGDPLAQYTLGTIYQNGLGVNKNNTTAIKWYRKAANQGHRGARKRLGGCRIC